MLDITYFDGETLSKVYQAIGKAQPYLEKATLAEGADVIVDELQNAGILFRERPPENNPEDLVIPKGSIGLVFSRVIVE